jgi:hypothetical protein
MRAAIASALLATLLAGCMTASGWRGGEDGFFIDGAALANPDYLAGIDARPVEPWDDSTLGLFAHRVSAGTGTVVGYRAYSPGKRMLSDDESFEKVTLWFKQGPLPAGTTQIHDDTVVVVHTRGGSAWPRSACSAVVVNGSIDIARQGEGVDVRVRGDLARRGNRHPQWCEQARLDVSFSASAMPLASLTPWLGSAGAHPYDESYRR